VGYIDANALAYSWPSMERSYKWDFDEMWHPVAPLSGRFLAGAWPF
jgi:hypothetical protein